MAIFEITYSRLGCLDQMAKQEACLPVAYHEVWHLKMSWAIITASFLIVQPGKYQDKGVSGSQITTEIQGRCRG